MNETFVLLHGSWHGGWAWEPAAWCLRELGHTVYTPTYPGHWPGVSRAGITHDDYVRAVTDFIEQRDLRDVILVGHSFGGSVVSRVSQEIPDRLKRLVFHTAFVVEDGASVNDNFPPEQTELFAQAARQSPDNTVECRGRCSGTCSSRTRDRRTRGRCGSGWCRSRSSPGTPSSSCGEFYRAGLPKSYIAVADDRALPAGTWHPGMSSRLGPCKIVHMAGSHEVMFTRPAELARTLVEAAHD